MPSISGTNNAIAAKAIPVVNAENITQPTQTPGMNIVSAIIEL